jgi:glycosyltransferase involved in cell wall biosynthesis
MRILWVKGGKLLPIDTGGKIRSYNILRRLARAHTVTLLSYYGGDRDVGYEAEITRDLPGTQTIHTAAPEATLAQSFDYVCHLPSRAPYAVTKFTHPKVQRTLAEWLSQSRFDVAVCDFLSATLNFPTPPAIPTVLFQHNVETVLWRRLAETETSPLRRLCYQIEAAKMARYEPRALAHFHHVIAVSNNDRDLMRSAGANLPITVVPTGVDAEKYSLAPASTGNPPIVVFTGSMDWEPNLDAAEYFCREIWPAILAVFPNARFQIVGRNPHDRIRRLSSSSIEVTGTVPSVFNYLRDATVVIVPLRIGGGTRLKIFEAMAMGKALVSTSIGAEGLDVVDGRDLWLADDPATFAKAVLDLLRDPSLRRRYEQAAAIQARRYDWSRIAEAFADVLRQTIAEFQASHDPNGAVMLRAGS